jgi:hypothetical protein
MQSFLRFSSALLASALFLAACTGDEGNGDQAQIRMLNVSPGYESLDLFTNNNDDDDDSDSLAIEAVAYESASAYVGLDSDTYTLRFKRNGVTSTLQVLGSETLADESHATYVAYGSSGSFNTIRVDEDLDEPDENLTTLTIVNTSEAGSLDVYLTDASVSLDDASPQFGGVAAGQISSPLNIDSGTYRLRVTAGGDTADLRLDVADVPFGSEQVITLVLSATPGGVLVNAMYMPQQGDLTVYKNTKARVRGAVGTTDGNIVTARVGDARILSNSGPGVISPRYLLVEAGIQSVTLGINGTAVPAADQTLKAGTDYTLLVWSTDATGTQTTLLEDDNRLPSTSGKTKVRLVNGMSAVGVPTTLSVDFSPLAEGIQLGTASSAVEIDGGTDFLLDVRNTTTAALLAQLSGVTLSGGGVYTVFAFGSNGLTPRKDR